MSKMLIIKSFRGNSQVNPHHCVKHLGLDDFTNKEMEADCII